jgi:hypothetical protein
LYLCIPPVWGVAGGDLSNPHYLWEHYGDQKEKKTGPQELKEKRGSPSSRSLQDILQQEAGSSGSPLRSPAATNEPAIEITAKARDEPVVRNLPEVKPKISLRSQQFDIPLQGASSSSTPTVREDLRHLVSGVGGIRLVKKTLSVSA